MTTSKRLCLFLSVCFLCFFPSVVLAAHSGMLRGIIFEGRKERPFRNVIIRINGHKGEVHTDRDGAFMLCLPAGKYKLTLRAPKYGMSQTKPIPIIAGEVTEVVISLRRGKDKKIKIDVEAAIRKIIKRKQKQYKGPTIKVTGTILHKKKKTPIEGARIYIRGSSSEAISDAKGRFVLKLPLGKHDVTVIHPKFSTAFLRGIQISTKGSPTLHVEMNPAALQLKTFTITAPRITGSTIELMKQRKQASSVSEVLGAQEIARTGDSNAASALKRVSGVTLVGGKYIYVRGLGERYSSALLNGSTLPSPEPERRVIPLDLFPAGVLEKVVIEKTYLPYMPGEFAGGSVQLFTKGFPTSFRASLSASFGLSLGASLTQGLRASGGPLDILGFDMGTRALPSEIAAASKKGAITERDLFSSRGYTAKQLEQFGESMPNRWKLSRELLPPNFGLGFSIGDSYNVRGSRWGYFLSVSYGNSWNLQHAKSDIYVLGGGGKLELAHQYRFETVENNIRFGGLFVFGVDFSKSHKIRMTTLLNRITSNEARRYEGPNRDVDTDIRVSRSRWIEQMLLTQQIRGIHKLSVLGGLNVDWRYTYSLATRNEPDRTEVRYDKEPGSDLWILSDRPEGNQRLYSDLLDHNHDLGFDLTFFFKQRAKKKGHFRFGGTAVFKSRNTDTRRYKFLHKGRTSGDSDILSSEPEDIFVPENIGADGFQFGEITRNTDNYKAGQQIAATYAMFNLPVVRGLRLIGGARLEFSRQNVETFALFSADKEPVVAELTTLDILPALALAWHFTQGMVFRAAFSRTVSRPDFRELSPATFNDVTGGRQIYGNPDLERAIIWHGDARWEWYWGKGQSLSVGAFYKQFEKPIETIVVVSAQHSITYANAIGAKNLGMELDLRTTFGFVHKYLRDFYLSGNLTFIWSQIELDEKSGGIQTSNSRALQGQSPYVINGQMGYDNAEMGIQFALLYNVFGPRIASVGALGAPDIFERSFHQLDFVFRMKLWQGLNLSIKAKNLLDLPVVFTQGDKVTSSYGRGRAVSVGLGYKFK